jgi:hypothetical protein
MMKKSALCGTCSGPDYRRSSPWARGHAYSTDFGSAAHKD